MILDLLKKEIKKSMISKDLIKRDLLRLVVGTAEQNDKFDDQNMISIISKIIKSNSDTMDQIKSDEKYKDELGKLSYENNILKGFLPAPYSFDEIDSLLQKNSIDLSKSKSEGHATGQIMKILKQDGSKIIDSDIVKSVVKTHFK